MIRHLFFIFFAFLCIPFLSAQDSLSIEEAIAIGLKNNFDILVSEKEVEIAKNNNSWGNAGAYPTISLNALGRFSHSNSVNNSLIDANTTQTLLGQPSVELSWIVFNGWKIRTTKTRLANLQDQSEGNAAIVVENNLQSIILAYYLAKLNEEALKVTQEVLVLSRDKYQYELAKKAFGNAVTLDVLQAKNNYLSDSSNMINQRINLQNSLRNLNLVLAEPIEKDYVLSSDFDVDKNDRDFELATLISKMESNNKTLQNQYIYQEILKKNTRLSQAGLYPVVNLSLGAELNYTGVYYDMDDGSWSDTYGLNGSLALSWTLSNGGNVRRAIQNAKINEEIGQIETEKLKRTMYNLIFKTFEEYSLKRQLRDVSQLATESAKLSFQIAKEKFKSGTINSFDFRDIQVSYLNAANQMLEANYNLIDAYTELIRLTGGIVDEYTEEN